MAVPLPDTSSNTVVPPAGGPTVVRLFVERLRVPSLVHPDTMTDTICLDAHPATLPHLGVLVRRLDVPFSIVDEDIPWNILVSGLGQLDLTDTVCDVVGLRVRLAGAVRVQPGFTYYAARLLGAGSLRTGAGAGVVWKGKSS
ncbi:MAG: hypothetical protein JJU05_11735 [Verrucomicrobia bacterium]|nr:hypothetical protein [Verrucomicrobiota bacterium]MCH8528051.1 hypothetical protein [Kiritimatiellia bacterium]